MTSHYFQVASLIRPLLCGWEKRTTDGTSRVGHLYDLPDQSGASARATGWAKGQALQWAASSVQAGLGFLCRLGMRRLGWTLENSSLSRALGALRPYRGGPADELIKSLYERIQKQIGTQIQHEDVLGDDEEIEDEGWRPNSKALESLLNQGVELLNSPAARAKWQALERLIDNAQGEKIVLFAQPVETVTFVANYLKERYHQSPAIIIGNQSEEERRSEVETFQRDTGPQFLVSSRAGGEGLNMQRAHRLIHLDVPWNPMEFEQRVGRIHRFGSRQTVIVDNIVVAGSREVDMYRIARAKLHLIASQLDPEQFEALFSRVMSLVPPQELEEVLGHSATAITPARMSDDIGRLVSEGYSRWQRFDEAYRGNAEGIRNISAGEATWFDLGWFLIRFCSAKPGSNSTFASFEFKDDEIVSVHQTVPTVLLGDSIYACEDTGGLPVEFVEGKTVKQGGLNVPEIADYIRDAFWPEKSTGAGYLTLKRPATDDTQDAEPLGILFFLRQTVRQELGRTSEEHLSLRAFTISKGEGPVALSSQGTAKIIRDLADATRIRAPVNCGLEPTLLG